jgi:hypothetical protein
MLLQFAFIPAALAQSQKADPKLLAEIAGSFEFDYQGEVIVFVFSVKDGDLMTAPEGEPQEAMELIEGEAMKFRAYTPDGMEIHFAFARDDEGKITKCTAIAPDMGIEVEGVRIK